MPRWPRTCWSAWRRTSADFTLTFRRLCDAATARKVMQPCACCSRMAAAYDAWAVRWRRRLAEETADPDARGASMRAVNPAFIPRNHLVEAALDAAVTRQDFAPFEELLEVLSRPYEDRPGYERYAAPPLRRSACNRPSAAPDTASAGHADQVEPNLLCFRAAPATGGIDVVGRADACRFASSTISHSRKLANDRRSSFARASPADLISGSSRSDTGIFVLAT